ncbi:MAG: tyrosine-type recombinase/integrase [Candidatus Omnitrophica bacterium]|nr:tyrosine-type recombinase/integrase [Candidatus Omnitrophota bacterium]
MMASYFLLEGMIRPIKNGASLYVVQKLLGHSSPEMTQRYAHLGSDQLKEEVNLLDDKRGQFFDLGHILVTRQNAPQKQEKVKHTTR